MENDFLLIWKMKNGDEAAMDLFVHKYYPVILKYCTYHISGMEDAEDIVQETFLHFFRVLPDYQYRGKTLNYLYRIAGNLCRDFYRKKKDMNGPLTESIQAEEGQMAILEERIDIEQALNQLPDELREAVILFYFQELKLKEIAQIQGISLSLVKYRIKKAKEQLEQLLERREQSDRSGETIK